MGWSVILQDSGRHHISGLSAELEEDNHEKRMELKLLRSLDAYGDTRFNHLQMDEVISDLKVTGAWKKSAAVAEAIILAQRCKQADGSLTLCFFGD